MAKSRWFASIVFVSIACGLFFRLYHLDRKVMWSDEIFSQIRITGLTESEIDTASSKMGDVESLRSYLADAESRKKGEGATIRSLVTEDPHHSPLYYLIAGWWFAAFGDSVSSARLLSAILGMAALPCIYFLARELSPTRWFAWTSVAFIAVSPYFVAYSQEVREYALWTVAVLLSSTLALRAVRRMDAVAWTAYAASISFALYTDPLSLAVVAAHVGYFLSIGRARIATAPIAPALAVVGGVLSFAPWLAIIATHRGQIDRELSWVIDKKVSPFDTLRTFFGEWHLAMIDFNSVGHSLLGLGVSTAAFLGIATLMVLTWREATSSLRVFLVWLVVVTVAPFLLPDIFVGGRRSSNARYLVPLFISIELALAFAASRMMGRDRRWSSLSIGIVLAGIISCSASAQAYTWWNKYNEQSLSLANVINAFPRPIIVSDGHVHLLLSMLPYLRPSIRLQLRPVCYLCQGERKIVTGHGLVPKIQANDDVFLLAPSAALTLAVGRSVPPTNPERVHCIEEDRNCANTLLHVF